MRHLAVLGAILLAAIAAPASAAIVFTVNGAFSSFPIGGAPQGTLTGTFTTDDALTTVTAVDLTSSAFGPYQSAIYNSLAGASQDLPDGFAVGNLPQPFTSALFLYFSTPLTVSGGTFDGEQSGEDQLTVGGVPLSPRYLNGSVTAGVPAAAGVPEPAAWALMIVGFGLAGAALRRRRTHEQTA
jgi:hypothetical protein